MANVFHRHCGVAAVFPADNIDTDQIIPSREMKAVSREGLGEGLFAGWRYLAPGGRDPNPEFVLNRPEHAGASILITGANFGCGSSREHAVWALVDYGIRAIIARSFGEIFHGNCLRNGLLPVVLQDADMDLLMRFASGASLVIDLAAQTVTSDALPDWSARFDIGAYPKMLLLEGLDPIGLTLLSKDEISNYIEEDRRQRPWVYPAG